MKAFWVVAAIIIPWAAGTALALLIQSRARQSYRDNRIGLLFALGAGWPAGQVMVMTLLYVVLTITDASQSRWILGLLTVLGGLFWFQVVRQGILGRLFAESDVSERSSPSSVSWVSRILIVIIGSSLLVKIGLIACAHAVVPVRNDDAISMWLFKAKVIATLDQLLTDPSHDYYLGGSNPKYPVFAPLLAAWVPLVAGTWSEQLATLSWLGFYLSLPLLAAGGLRHWLGTTHAWITAYLVASMPLLVVHAYRPGYADLPMGVFLAATVLCLLLWRSTDHTPLLVFAVVLAVATASMKREGPVVAAVAGTAVMIFGRRHVIEMSMFVRLSMLVTFVASVLTVASVVDVSDVSENLRGFQYESRVWVALTRHLFHWSSFHFMGWGVVAAVFLLLFRSNAVHRGPAILLVLGLLGLDACIFLFTPQARFALNDQTPSRLFLQALPGVVLALAIPVGTCLRGQGRSQQSEQVEAAQRS